MVQGAVIVSILYFVIVNALSFLLEKIHVIKKPPLKKGFLSSVAFYAGIALAMAGIYLFGSSRIPGILCCLAGIALGVLKTSSDGPRAAGINVRPVAKEEMAEAGAQAPDDDDASTPLAETVPEPKELIPAPEANDAPGGAAEAWANEVREQTILTTVKGGRAAFLYPNMILSLFLSLSVVLLALSLLVSFITIAFAGADPDDIAGYFRLIAALDFDNRALQSGSEAQASALAAAYGLSAALALSILSAILGLAIRIFRNNMTAAKVVSALLPGKKRGFVPSPEGIYKLCYLSPLGKRCYVLHPWESLSLNAIHEKKKRVVLTAGKVQMPLVPWNRGLFNDLKGVVLAHLPKEGQTAPAKRVRYRWGRVAICVLVVFSLQVALSTLLESASNRGEGTKYCDVGGSLHVTYRTAFGPPVYVLWLYGEDDQTRHTYCALHGACYLVLHPTVYARSIERLLREDQFSMIIEDPIMVAFFLILPPLVWLYLLVFAVSLGKPRRYRFRFL